MSDHSDLANSAKNRHNSFLNKGIHNNDICLRVLVEKNAIQFNIKNRFTLGFLKLIKIRPAVTSDIPQLVLLLEALFSIEADFLIDYDKQATGLDLLINSSKDCVWVAEVGGIDQVVGMCSIQTMISTAEGGLVGVVEDLIGLRYVGSELLLI